MHRIRKFIASALAFAMLAGTVGATAIIPGSDTPFGITVSAAETTANDFTWDLDSNGVLTITGTGEMPSYDWSKSSFTKSQVKKVIISEGVTVIPKNAFYDEKYWESANNLETVVLPSTLTEISSEAFRSCSNLQEIYIPNSVTSIGANAFHSCMSLTSIEIPGSVTSIGVGAFSDCSSLTSVIICDGVKNIGDEAFWGCTKLTSIVIPDSVTMVASDTFCGTAWYDSQPNGLVYAGKVVCGYKGEMSENTSIKLKNDTKGIGFAAFSNCTSLTSIEIPDSVTSIGDYAFSNCTNLTGIEIPGSVMSIGLGAFKDCSSLTSAIIGDGVKTIGNKAFSGCSSLTSIEIPGNVTSIGEEAFWECTKLTSAIIGDGVKTIGNEAFCFCDKLTSVKISNCVTCIGNSTFYGCSSLTNIEIPSSVTIIESLAFEGCSSLTSIVIPGSVTSIGSSAFEYCSNLTSVVIPSGITYIDFWTFNECSNLKDVYYYGTEDEWRKITIRSNNEYLTKATMHYNCRPNETLDEEIVRKTKLYTSDGGAVYRKVLESLNENLSRDDISREDKIAMLNNFYKLFNITDIQEGTAYCLEAMNGKKAYDYLTNDEIFLSYQFKNYLQNTEKGTIARGLMITDGWIFNNELKQWIDPKTYITQETVDIKNYKAMLLSFMYYEAETGAAGDVSEIVGYADKVRTHIEYLAENLDEAAKKNIKKDLADVRKNYNTMTSEQVRQEMQRIWNKYQLTDTIENGKITYHVKGFDELSKALQISGNVFQITVTSIDDIMDIVNVENKLETIEKYRKFLELVANGKDYLPGDLVIAANQLLNETIMPYFKQFVAFIYDEAVCVDGIFDVSKSLKKQLSEKLTSKYPKLFEGKLAGFASTFGDAVAVIKISAVVTNAITNIGTTIKDAAYVEAYAYLGEYFSDILRNKKDQFNTDQSAENAWEFYDIYNLLFRIRACGENSYLKMCDDSPVTWILSGVGFNYFDIKDRKKYVEGTFDYMNNYCFFGLENADQIPESHKFAQKAVIKCPVNVEIYDLSGNLVYTIFDGKEIDETNEIGRFISTYDPKLGEYIKIVYLENRDNYTVKNVGVDFGNVSIETAVVNSDDTVTTAKVSGLPIEEYGIITVDMQTNQYTDDQNGDGNVEYTGVLQNTETSEVVNVTGIELSANTLKLNAGEKTALGVMISPDNATFTDVIWSSDNEDVAMVNNGAVTAISAGTATITAITSNGITATCTVTVVELTGGVIGDVNGDGSADIADSLFIARADAGLATLSDDQAKAADVNRDGSADIADALFIARVDAGLAKV